ncbi:hypothetical protein IAE35_05515 [Pseudomonas sp. S75]|uniref:hypothetical protein n=1 Tax=unclassified Pseudomonas TaxID=196821 RepID=UPI001903B79B|nr:MULTISPECIES: hypothetical protein [unclassified Pseudomonas]MBJ9975236.1 hypothetical protein [Pseudomonas sp. S30]MBK0152790.1 hypothetical protein [Pseudomonas sp. S75]
MKARLFEYDWLKKGDADEICFPGTFKSMKWAGFMLCVVSTLMYLFACTDRFGKRQWRRFGLQCLAVLAGAFLLAL